MSCVEEQGMEMEALESLFPVELEKVNETEFNLSLVPYADNSRENHVSVKLGFKFGLEYPERSSELECIVLKSSGSVSSDSSLLHELNSLVEKVKEENNGSCCVYQIADAVQDWLRNHNEPERSLHDLIGVREKKDSDEDDSDDDSDWSEDSDCSSQDYSDEDESESEEEYKELELKTLCQESDRVQKDEFIAWKVKFYDQELLQAGLIKRVAPGDTRITGKLQFLESLAGRKATPQGEEFSEELFTGDIDEDLE
jgi:hypothetical protein